MSKVARKPAEYQLEPFSAEINAPIKAANARDREVHAKSRPDPDS